MSRLASALQTLLAAVSLLLVRAETCAETCAHFFAVIQSVRGKGAPWHRQMPRHEQS